MKKNYYIILFLCFSLSTFIQAQTPCKNGMAGEYPCKDYDFMSQIPVKTLASDLGSPEGSDLWGWTDPKDKREYAIVGLTNSTAFVDVTDPLNPVFLGRINSANGKTSYWRDVKIYKNHAFIVADNLGDHGMQVFDLRILRNGKDADLTFEGNEVLTFKGNGGTDDIEIESCHNIVINEDEGVAYLVGCKSANGGGPIFVDVSDPTKPNVLGDYTDAGYSHDAQVVTYTGPDKDYYDPDNEIIGKQIYIGSNGGTDTVVILDVTDKKNIVKINEFTYDEIQYAHQGWFTEDQKYFLLGDELDEQSNGSNTRTMVFNLEDLDADFTDTSLTKYYSASTAAIDHNGYVKGDRFYIASYRAGFRALDIPTLISNDNTKAEVGFFDTYPEDDKAEFNGAWSIYPYFASGNIIISDIEKGLIIIRKSNTLSTPAFTSPKGFTLSPNPTSGTSTLKDIKNRTIKSVEIYTSLGQKIYTNKNINTQEFVLPTSGYAAGVYLVRINNTNTKKLVIQ